MRNSLKLLLPAFPFFKENNENEMSAHGICFDFCYWPKPIQIGLTAAADAHFAGKKV